MPRKVGGWIFSDINSNIIGSAIYVTINREHSVVIDISDNKYSHSISVNDKEMAELKGCCNKKLSR